MAEGTLSGPIQAELHADQGLYGVGISLRANAAHDGDMLADVVFLDQADSPQVEILTDVLDRERVGEPLRSS